MADLFTPISRDERQLQSKRAWIKAKGKGTIEACTGYGKTRVALDCIQAVLGKYPSIKVIVIVPTDGLKQQWLEKIDERGLGLNTEVIIINTACKNEYQCDMLVIDEIHRVPAETFSNVFKTVKYKLILGLTATIERLDGKHSLIQQYCPVVDTITLEVAKMNGWVSDFTEYQVIITVDDIDKYREYNKEFVEHFEFFNFDFNLAMSMLGAKGYINRASYRDELFERLSPTIKNGSNKEQIKKDLFKSVTYHATAFMRAIQNRKKFIHNHPEKLRVAQEIIKHRLDKKIITFSANTDMAEQLDSLAKENFQQNSFVYTGKTGKKKNRTTIESFSTLPYGQLHSCKLAIEGLDCPGLSVGIMLGVDSSSTKSIQSAGRVIRKEGSKYSEIFTLVLESTVECEWFKKSHEKSNYVTIDVDNLMKVLNGEPYEPYKKKIQNFTYRF